MTKKETAINLRKEGKTCGEIMDILNSPKSTVWSWIKSAVLTEEIKNKILEKAKEKCRKNILFYNTKVRPAEAAKIRSNWTKKGAEEIKNVSKNELKLIGSALYWAEGSSKNRNSLRFGNSNPLIIKTIIKFFKEICEIPEKKIGARIHLYPCIKQEEATNYWVEITGLPKVNFYPPQIQISRASRGKRPKNTLPFGTLHLTINNTEITSRVKGWIQGISEKI